MNRSLWLLLGLQLRGWVRYVGSSLKSVRGAFLAVIGLLFFVPWLLAVLAGSANQSGLEADQLVRFGPAGLLLYCVLNVVFSSQDRAIYFSPAEVQFLFTGPYTRKQILAYKLALTLLVSLPATLIMGTVFRVRHGWMLAVLSGWLMISVFMQLFAIVLALVASATGEHLLERSRRVVVTLALLAAGVVVWQSVPLDLAGERFTDTVAWQVLSWPLRSFFDAIQARTWAELALPLAVAAGVNVALVGVIFLLDAHYLEASAAASARLYARIQRMRGRNAEVEDTTATKKPVSWSLPGLPYWGGVGPVLWRQLTAAIRGLRRLIVVVALITGFLTLSFLGSPEELGAAAVPAIGGLGVWLSIFLTALVPFDFRGDIDRMATLKTLPIVPWRLALGQLLAPALLIALFQFALVVLIGVLAPGRWLLLAVLAAYTFPISFVLVALENLLFLLFPVRMMASTPGDFQSLGRNVLMTMGKLFGLMAVVLGALVPGTIAFMVTRQLWIALAAGWPVVVVAGVVLVPLCGLAFQWFEVGRDTPA